MCPVVLLIFFYRKGAKVFRKGRKGDLTWSFYDFQYTFGDLTWGGL